MKYLVVSGVCEGTKELLTEIEHIGFKTAALQQTDVDYKNFADNYDVIGISFKQIKPFIESCPDTVFGILYMKHEDYLDDKWLEFALKNGFETEKDFKDAIENEEPDRKAFETLIDTDVTVMPNLRFVFRAENDFETSVNRWADYLRKHSIMMNRLAIVVKTLIKHDVVRSNKPDTMVIVYEDEKTGMPVDRDVSIDAACCTLCADNEGMATMIKEFLMIETLPVLNGLSPENDYTKNKIKTDEEQNSEPVDDTDNGSYDDLEPVDD